MKAIRLSPRSWLPVLLLVACGWLRAADEDRLTVDPQVHLGRLDNGLTYYVRENAKPANRAALRLVVNAGSVLEAGDQRGLAHFLEHLAFNGTAHFAKHELVDFLEGIGMRFGPELNAFTSFDETVYLLEIPLDQPEVIEKAFVILSDWASAVALDPEEIEKERGVVLEEWRLGRGAQQRILDRQIPALLHDSRYAERLPIGDTNIIATAERPAFARFYRDWYRPDLMAVIAVGDFQAEAMEARIRRYFGPLTNPEGAPPRPAVAVPDHAETLFSIATDPELPYTAIQIAYKHAPTAERTRGDYRRSLVEALYTGMVNERLEERTREANPPYLYAGMGKISLVRTKEVFIQTAAVKEGAFAEGLQAMLLEARRVRRDGFTPGEMERAKANLLRSYEQAYAERDKLESGNFAAEYMRNFLEQEPIPGLAAELGLVREYLPGIRLDEVNLAARNWITDTNRVVLYSAPEKAGLAAPTQADIIAVVEAAATADVEAYADAAADAPLLAALPEPGRVIAANRFERIEVTEWVLSNGARVWVKPTDFKNDQVLLTAFSPGGLSLVSDADFIPASTAVAIVGESGLGAFDQTALRKKLAGKIVGVRPSLGDISEGLSGSASPQDLETLFQLVYLTFTAPRADAAVYSALQTRMRETVQNRLNDPDAVFADAVSRALYGNHPRHQPATLATIEAMDRETSLRVLRERFANAGDFTFVLVGNLDPATLRPLVEQYLASLPGEETREVARFQNDLPARGQLEVTVRKGVEARSTVELICTGPAQWSYDEMLRLRVAIEVLRIRLRETLREEQGGTYGVSVSGGIERWPVENFTCSISFGCAPDRVDSLIALAAAEVARLQAEGPRADDLAKVKETQLRTFERGVKENPFWLGNLAFRAQHGLDPEDLLSFPERVKALEGEAVRDAAQRYFATDNRLVAKLYPESVAP